MRTASTTRHHARWRPRLDAILEAGAAIRTRMARLVSGGDHAVDEQLDEQPAWPAGDSPSLRPPGRAAPASGP